MKRKSYVMPIVLLIFALLIIAFFSIYHRTISTHNHKNSKELEFSKKIEKINFEEILSTKATINFINSKLIKRENFSLNIDIYELLKLNNITDFSKNFDKYKLTLNSQKSKRDINFFTKKSKKPKFVRKYEIFLKLSKNGETLEYRIVDKKRIENYLLDLQLKTFIDRKAKFLGDDFYFSLDKDFSKLYDRIFSDEIQDTYSGDFRIYDFKGNIYFIDNSQYLKLQKFYFSNKKIELEDFNLDLCDIDEFVKEKDLKDLSRDDFIEKLLLQSSKCIRDYKNYLVNIEVKDKLYFDLNIYTEIYTNLKIGGDLVEIITTNKVPKLQGVFVNNSLKDNFDFVFEGVLFSKNKLKSKYKFLPDVLDITSRFIKISDDFYLEKIEKGDIK